MHDIRFIRENPTAFDAGLKRRGLSPLSDKVLELDRNWRDATQFVQESQATKNQLARQIGEAKKRRDEAAANELLKQASVRDAALAATIEQEAATRKQLDELLLTVPNLPQADVPDGRDEKDNVEIRRNGSPRNFSFKPKEHFETGEALGLMDFEAAARVSGSRFVYLKAGLARLERAIGAFMIDLQTREFGYTEVAPPLLVRDQAMYGTAQLPKFREEQFGTTNGYWLIPTSEVALTNMVREQILNEADLPMRVTALTPCFRSEAGAAGKDTRGMIRMHQFTKVELISITAPEQSAAEHERMTSCAEEVLKRLNLPYRTVVLCAGDMGFGSQKTYDIEVWLPGQAAFREISSCSNCGDFQARRMDARYRPAEGKGTRFVHTLNGSGLAVGRTLIAVMENYQEADGSITVPKPLVPYMGGLEVIGKK